MTTYLSQLRVAELQRRGDASDQPTPRLRVFAACLGRWRCVGLVLSVFAAWLSVADAQQVLDRVVARVGSVAITQTDVDAAVAFGIVDGQQGADARRQLIDRRLILTEVSRFPPPEPLEMDITALVAKMKAAAGSEVNAVMARTGTDDRRLLELARETLRIRAYIAQRFGSGPQADQQTARWVEDLRARGDVTVISSPR